MTEKLGRRIRVGGRGLETSTGEISAVQRSPHLLHGGVKEPLVDDLLQLHQHPLPVLRVLFALVHILLPPGEGS